MGTTVTQLQGARLRETLSYKQTPKGERKAGIKFWLGRQSRTLFWSDLWEVDYDPDAIAEEEGEPELSGAVEKLTLRFHQQVVTIKGFRLGRLDEDCQNHLTDFIRRSTTGAIMTGAAGNREEPPVITHISFANPEKKKSR